LVHDLEPASAMGGPEKGSCKATGDGFQPTKEFPTFHAWLEELFEETEQGAALGHLLLFRERRLEAAYVAHYIRSTCQQVLLLALCLTVYSCWCLTTEDWGWKPAVASWDHNAKIAHHIAWMVLAASGLVVMLRCALSLRAKSAADQSRDESVRDQEAVRLERFFLAWACSVQWVGCFFANRFRVSVLFGASAEEVFESLNSDYDLIVTMIGTLVFFSTRTYVRFVSVLPLATSCVLAYAVTSTFLGVADSRCREEKNWAWPAILLSVIAGLCLSGHRAVEYHRRLTFLSLYASYSVLQEVQADVTEEPEPPVPTAPLEPQLRAGQAGSEVRSARLKRALDLVRRLSESGELASRPLRAALQSLTEVLQKTREDISEVERLMVVNVEEKLRQHGIAESAQGLLLPMFDALPPIDEVHLVQGSDQQLLTSTGNGASAFLGGWDTMSGELEAARPWGWDTLSEAISGGSERARALAITSSTLLLPAVATAAAAHGGPEAEEVARSQARALLDALLQEYDQGPRSAEARATLAVQAAHWLAHRLGLWALLQPWERVALLVSAVGLYCGLGRSEDSGGGALIAKDPLLAHAASAGRTLAALDVSGLASGGVGGQSEALRVMVRRLLVRARPRCMLEDSRRMRAHFERDDQIPVAPDERAVLTSLVLAAADLSFLALPASQHRAWALQSHAEASDVAVRSLVLRIPMPELDVASWFRGLVEVLALPVYETLSLLVGAEAHLAAPLRHLRENAKYWKIARLVAAPPQGPCGRAEQASPHEKLPNKEGAQCQEASGAMAHARDVDSSGQGTLPPGTLLLGTLPPGTLKFSTSQAGMTQPGTTTPGTLAPGTLRSGGLVFSTLVQASLPRGTLTPSTLPPGTLTPGLVAPGLQAPGALSYSATLPGTLACLDASHGNADPQHDQRGNEAGTQARTRASTRLPGQVSPLSEADCLEAEYC